MNYPGLDKIFHEYKNLNRILRKLIFLWQQSEIDEPYSAKDKIKKIAIAYFLLQPS